MKKLLIIMILACVCLSLVACEKSEDEQIIEQLIELDKLNEVKESGEVSTSGEEVTPEETKGKYSEVTQNPIVTMEMEDGGIVKIELYPQIAPNSVENFISLIKRIL